jgi:hypothetical protein
LTIKAPPATGVTAEKPFQNLYDAADVLVQGPDVAAPETRTLVSGVLSLNDSRNVWVQTEGAASLDQLTEIDLDTLPENLAVRIRQANVDHVVDIVHLSNAGDGDGEFSLNAVEEAGSTVRLDSLEKSLTVERRGDTIYELRRDGFAGTGGFDGELTEPLDGGDQPVSRLRWTMEDAIVVSGEYVALLTDSGKWKNVRTDCEVELPDPNETDSGWLAGHNVTWQQWSSLLTFVTHVGTTPQNPNNHDRGQGMRSVLQTIVCEENDGTLSWLLSGMTAAEDDGGGGGGGGTAIVRSYAYTDVLPTVVLPTGSTAFVSCGSLTFTPEASSDYLLFCDHTLSADAINTTNNSSTRLVNTAAPTTALCEVGRPRTASHVQRSLFMYGFTSSASPSALTYRLEAANGASSTYSTRVQSPQIIALKLEADEGYALQSGVVSDTNQTYDTVATLTKTLTAGTYIVGGQFTAATSTDHRWYGKITAGGTDYNETLCSNIDPGKGLYSTFRVLSLSGSTTVTVQIKSGASGGTATATHGIVFILAAAEFQVFDSGESTAETSAMTSATLQNKVSKDTALQTGWRSLVLATTQAYAANDDAGEGCKVEFHRNGSAIGPSAIHTGREFAGITLGYSPMSWGAATLLAPSLATDTFQTKYASVDGSVVVKVASSTVAVLALGPTS